MHVCMLLGHNLEKKKHQIKPFQYTQIVVYFKLHIYVVLLIFYLTELQLLATNCKQFLQSCFSDVFDFA